MTGADVKRQVEATGYEVANAPTVLDDPRLKYREIQIGVNDQRELLLALDALAPCIVLTAEEAAQARLDVSRLARNDGADLPRLFALLTPDQEASDDRR